MSECEFECALVNPIQEVDSNAYYFSSAFENVKHLIKDGRYV